MTANDLRPLLTAACDYEKTEQLKARFKILCQNRKPFFLTASDIDEVFRWKLIGQYSRGAKLRRNNPPGVYEIVTRACFELNLPDFEYEARLRIGILSALQGVGVPVASALLALVDPTKYCVIDFGGWRAVFGVEKRTFTITDYLGYLRRVRPLAEELGRSVQETDLAIWEFDKRRVDKAVFA